MEDGHSLGQDDQERGGSIPINPQSRLEMINHILVGDFEFGSYTRRYLSLVLLLIAATFAFFSYKTATLFGLIERDVSFKPDMVSTLFAFMIVVPLYIRRVLEFSVGVYSLVSFALNVTITSSLIKGLLGSATILPTELPMQYLLIFALIMTWLGMRPLAIYVWAAVVLVGIYNLNAMSNAMGLAGYGFIFCGAVGILLQVAPGMARLKDELAFDFNGSHGTEIGLFSVRGEAGRRAAQVAGYRLTETQRKGR